MKSNKFSTKKKSQTKHLLQQKEIFKAGHKIKYPIKNTKEILSKRWEAEGNIIVKIRKILSGDTIQCETRKNKNIIISLNGIQAPRIARNEKEIESFFAYEAREFLRKKIAGGFGRIINQKEKELNKNIKSNDPISYWGNILVAENPQLIETTKWIDLTQFMLINGWVDIKDNFGLDDSMSNETSKKYL